MVSDTSLHHFGRYPGYFKYICFNQILGRGVGNGILLYHQLVTDFHHLSLPLSTCTGITCNRVELQQGGCCWDGCWLAECTGRHPSLGLQHTRSRLPYHREAGWEEQVIASVCTRVSTPVHTLQRPPSFCPHKCDMMAMRGEKFWQ